MPPLGYTAHFVSRLVELGYSKAGHDPMRVVGIDIVGAAAVVHTAEVGAAVVIRRPQPPVPSGAA